MSPTPDYLTGLFGLQGQIAIVTGGAGRLGSRYVNALIEAGASVAACDIAAAPSPLVKRAIDGGATIAFHAADVGNRPAMEAVVADIVRTYGTPTILVNNAGLGSSPADAALDTGPFEEYPDAARPGTPR